MSAIEEQPQILTSQTDSTALGIWNSREGALARAWDALAKPEPVAEAGAPETPEEQTEATASLPSSDNGSDKDAQQPAKPWAALDASFQAKAVVKNTFLEFFHPDDEEEQPRCVITESDSKALGISNCRDASFVWSSCLRSGPRAQDETPKPEPVLEAAAPEVPTEAATPDVQTGATASPALSDDGSEKDEPQHVKSLRSLDMSIQVQVKNTFLELVEEEPQGKILMSMTDPLALLRREGLLGGSTQLLGASQPCVLAAAGPATGAAAAALVGEDATGPRVQEAVPARSGGPSSSSSSKSSSGHEGECVTAASAYCISETAGTGTAASGAASAASSSGGGKFSSGHGSECVRAGAGRGARGARGGEAVANESEAPQPATQPVRNNPDTYTTVMVRNLPNDYMRDDVFDLLDTFGFAGKYDFVYYPGDFTRNAGLGYAFVNMVTAADAKQVQWTLEGFRQWSVPSSKSCSVGWCLPCQGLEANVERYRSSPVMHKSVPEHFKPVVFKDGQRIPFPKPTKKVKKPDMRKGGC